MRVSFYVSDSKFSRFQESQVEAILKMGKDKRLCILRWPFGTTPVKNYLYIAIVVRICSPCVAIPTIWSKSNFYLPVFSSYHTGGIIATTAIYKIRLSKLKAFGVIFGTYVRYRLLRKVLPVRCIHEELIFYGVDFNVNFLVIFIKKIIKNSFS